MTDWLPEHNNRRGPRYLTIVDAMQADILAGKLAAGAQLLPQRDMADRLNLSIGTISKAYAEAGMRGLIAGQVGRGTFVLEQRDARSQQGEASAPLNLALNVPVRTGEDKLISATLAEIAADGGVDALLDYLPHQGVRSHREAMGSWLAELGVEAHPDQIFVTEGAQHGLLLSAGLVLSAGDVILTEKLTYSGVAALAGWGQYQLRGVNIDAEGLVPEALDRAFTETGAKALFCTPTLQTPTGSTMSSARREQVAEIVRKHQAYLFEDDVYAFLFKRPPPPISSLIPERAFYLTSFAKCLAPGLRIGSLTAPSAFRDRCNQGVRVTGWMASPIMAEVVSRMIRNGALASQVRLKQKKAAARRQMVRQILADWLPAESEASTSFHIWLPLPLGRTVNMFIGEAARAGITLAPPNVAPGASAEPPGVRLCFGSPESDQDLAVAVMRLRKVLEIGEVMSLV